MAKAWRKHNMELAGKIKSLDSEIRLNRVVGFYYDEEKLQARREQLINLRLRNKTERRMQYAAEVSQPSLLLFTLFHHIGLPVPPELANNLNGKTISL
jgi:hypothetical protein